MATGTQTEGMIGRCLRRAFDEVPIGLAMLSARPDHCGQFVDVNPAMAALLGCQPAELLGRSLTDFLKPGDRVRYEALLSRLLATHRASADEFGVVANGRIGAGRRLRVAASLVRDIGDGASQIVINVEDVTRRREAEGRLIHLTMHDQVTGLPNRLLFADRISQALARAHRSGHLAVTVLDLERFGLVNETLGYAGGDRVLAEVGARIQHATGPGGAVARLSSDEFVVLVEGLSGERDAVALAERLQNALSAPLVVDGKEIFLSASIGIAVTAAAPSALPAETPESLLRCAKAAMERVKRSKKGGHAVFEDSMRPSGATRLEIASHLQRALERSELRVVYQPVYSLVTGRIIGAEALVRWHHPEWGVVAPLQFLGVAEDTGLVVPVGAFVLETACAQVRAWRRAGNDMVIAVNVSARELLDPRLTDRVANVLRANHLTPRHLTLEITESVLVESDGEAGATAQALRELGVGLAIDDFGTGYSSLSYVKRFPVDTIKVDRSFVDGIDCDGRESAIVERIIDLSHTLGMSCVAEGVETRGQLEELRRLGCDAAQGYLLGRPADADNLSARLDGRLSGRPADAAHYQSART